MSETREPPKQASEATPSADARETSAPAPPAADDSLRNAVGAYLLDALPDDERAAFEAFLATSPETQEEVRQLTPVVRLLPQLLDGAQNGNESAPAPTAELRGRILTEAEAGPASKATGPTAESTTPPVEPMEELAGAASALPEERAATDAGEAPEQPRTVRTAPPATTAFEQRRQAGGTPAAPRVVPAQLRTLRNYPASWSIAAGLAIVAVGAIIWALALLGQIDNKEREIAAQRERIVAQDSEIAGLRSNANATAFSLSAASDAAGNAQGTLLFALNDQIGVLYVRNLPPLDDNRVYQLWYVDDQTESPRPGGTFRVDRNGNGFIAVEPDTPTFDAIALTEESAGGSEAPTTPIVLAGRLGGAAG